MGLLDNPNLGRSLISAGNAMMQANTPQLGGANIMGVIGQGYEAGRAKYDQLQEIDKKRKVEEAQRQMAAEKWKQERMMNRLNMQKTQTDIHKNGFMNVDGVLWDLLGQKPVQGTGVKPIKPEEKFKMENTLRDDFTAKTKDFSIINNSWENIKGAHDTNGAGGLAMITNYMRMLDPNSVVREGEVIMANQSAGIVQQVQGWYNKFLEEGKLPETVAKNIREQSYSYYKTRYNDYLSAYKDFEYNVNNYGLDKRHVLGTLQKQDIYSFAPTKKKTPRKTSSNDNHETIIQSAQQNIEEIKKKLEAMNNGN